MPYKNPEARRKYMRLWMKRRRDEFFHDKTCEKCPSSENLELHHKDPASKISHRIWGWSKERREAEIAKCSVLCYKCHRAYEYEKMSRHGIGGYQRGCRCEVCRGANNARVRKQRTSRGRR